MSNIKLLKNTDPFEGEVELPISKSIANRKLIISAIAGGSIEIEGELPQDAQILQDALRNTNVQIDVGAAGTAMRFLTAYYAIQPGKEITLTGDDRMKQRPIGILVDVLTCLGAQIEYNETNGVPPIKIRGNKLIGGKITVPATVSSQFISALMMVAPTLEKGLEIRLEGNVLSRPYIELTASIMDECGVTVKIEDSFIQIPSSKYSTISNQLETDWSAASYFYALALTRPESKMLLKGLSLSSLQGDSVIVDWFERLGVSSVEKPNGVEINSIGILDFPSELDFTDNPDLAQTFAFLAAVLGKNLKLTGLDNLRFKETDRIAALKTELEKLGLKVAATENSLSLEGRVTVQNPFIHTYNDHRMAMGAAILSGTMDVEIEDPDVVDKSFPGFWRELNNVSNLKA